MVRSNSLGQGTKKIAIVVSTVLNVSVVMLSLGHAFISPPAQQMKRHDGVSTILFASEGDFLTKITTIVREDAANQGCGEGFYASEDGSFCVFDYDAAAEAFGTAEKEEMVNDPDHYWEELENQNTSRKKFGLDPLTPEQYVALQGQIHQMQAEQQEKLVKQQEQLAAAARVAANNEKDQRLSPSNLLKDFMSAVMQNTCESNYDCQRPEVCCDFGFNKKCCDGGKMNRELKHEYAMIPVPQQS